MDLFLDLLGAPDEAAAAQAAAATTAVSQGSGLISESSVCNTGVRSRSGHDDIGSDRTPSVPAVAKSMPQPQPQQSAALPPPHP